MVTTKDYAITMINALSEKQLESLVDFMSSFLDRNTMARIESMLIDIDPNPKTYNSFDEFLNEWEQENDE